MSEAMALETLAANVLGSKLNTALVKTRVRLMGPTAGYTDLDAVAAAPMRRTLAVAECKAQGSALQVYELNDYAGLSKDGYFKALQESAAAVFRGTNTWLSPHLQFGEASDPWSGLDRLELWLFANIYAEKAVLDAIGGRLAAEIGRSLGSDRPSHVQVVAHVVSTLDLVMDGFDIVERWVTEQGWGVRSGDPVLDALRELVRYKHAILTPGGRKGGAVVQNAFRERVRKSLLGE